MKVNLDIIKVIMLEVAESVEMKVDEYRHDFRPTHSPFPIAGLRPSGSQMDMRAISLSYSWQKSSIIQKISVILFLVISITIVSFNFIIN